MHVACGMNAWQDRYESCDARNLLDERNDYAAKKHTHLLLKSYPSKELFISPRGMRGMD